LRNGHAEAQLNGRLSYEAIQKLVPALAALKAKGALQFTADITESGLERSHMTGSFTALASGAVTCDALGFTADVSATASVRVKARARDTVSCQGPPALGGTLRLGKAQLSLNDGVLMGTATLKGDGFTVAGIQKAFCILSSRPLPGPVSLDYPDITVKGSSLAARGTLTAPVLGGELRLGDIMAQWGDTTKANIAASLRGLDLQEFSRWTNFGKVTGRLDITAENTEVVLTSHGMLPLQYDFTLKGRSEDGHTLNFSAEALDNLMDMMGAKDAASNPVGSFAFGAWRLFGSVFGFVNNMDYFGFHARTEGGYTTLTTFDPPGSKNHYLIRGMSFKMPMKSTGSESDIYPIIMKTASFQTWLWSMVDWFKNKNKNKESTDENRNSEQCTPLF
jgi:hypothetical protein